jgi:hypothetical protein
MYKITINHYIIHYSHDMNYIKLVNAQQVRTM